MIDLRGVSDGSQPIDATMDDQETRSDVCPSKGITFIARRTCKKRYVRKAESFPPPLRYIDVIKRTHSTPNVLQESRIDDYWNIDGD